MMYLRLLHLLFTFFTSWCLRIVPPFFLRDMHVYLHAPPASPAPKAPHYSPFLHNALLAVASAFSHSPEIASAPARAFFADKAKGYVEAECAHPSMSCVLALSILASFYSGMGMQTLGFMYFGASSSISPSEFGCTLTYVTG